MTSPRWKATGTGRTAAAVLLAALALWPGATGASADELQLEVDNDFLASNPEDDDLYTFSLGFGWEWGRYTVALRENAFTDKDAGVRFDETYLTLGRDLPLSRGWLGRSELGLVYVGRGLFGQSLQNGLHEVIGNRQLDLAYVDAGRVHPWGRLTFDRRLVRGPRLAWGPRFDVSLAPGFQSSLLGGVRAEYDARGPWAVAVTAGVRLSATVYEPLESHMSGVAAYGSLEVALWNRFVTRWSYNAYGTEREHVAFIWRFRLGERAGGPGRD